MSTAEELFQEARTAGIPVSLATVYNTLHQFTAAGLMIEVVVGSGQSYFDTNPTSHYHYFDKSTGEIIDVPENAIQFTLLPEPPPGKVIDRIDVVVRDPERRLTGSAAGLSCSARPPQIVSARQPAALVGDLDPAPVVLALIELGDHAGLETRHDPTVRSPRTGAGPGCPNRSRSPSAARTAGSNGPSRSRRPGRRCGARRRIPRRSRPAGRGAYRAIGSDGPCWDRCGR